MATTLTPDQAAHKKFHDETAAARKAYIKSLDTTISTSAPVVAYKKSQTEAYNTFKASQAAALKTFKDGQTAANTKFDTDQATALTNYKASQTTVKTRFNTILSSFAVPEAVKTKLNSYVDAYQAALLKKFQDKQKADQTKFDAGQASSLTKFQKDQTAKNKTFVSDQTKALNKFISNEKTKAIKAFDASQKSLHDAFHKAPSPNTPATPATPATPTNNITQIQKELASIAKSLKYLDSTGLAKWVPGLRTQLATLQKEAGALASAK